MSGAFLGLNEDAEAGGASAAARPPFSSPGVAERDATRDAGDADAANAVPWRA